MRIMMIFLYAVAVCAPAIIVTCVVDPGLLSHLSMVTMADLLALTAFAILSMQFVLSARIMWIERPFGLDRVMLFHRSMAVVAVGLLVTHPLLLAADPNSEDGWKLLYGFTLVGKGWKVLIGKAALTALVVTAGLSLLRASLRLAYHSWLRLHNILALCVIGCGFTHSVLIGRHIRGNRMMEALWSLYPVLAVGAFIYARGIRAAMRKVRAYRVEDIRQETDAVWTLTMTAPGNGLVYDYLPGQFHFLTLLRSGDRHHEQHPFTISSSPGNRTAICSSIKISGDYTATIGRTVIGDHVALLGPFGRFSYTLYPSERNLVFIAGGIGITPLMSMLRHMRDSGDAREVLLLYGNRAERDVVFRKELEEIVARGVPILRVIHVLSRAEGNWLGERGYITVEMIKKECQRLDGRVFYLCGPPVMMMGLVKGLKGAGVKGRHIRYERFAI